MDDCAVAARCSGKLRGRGRGDCGYGLPFRDQPSANREQHGERAEDGPAILLQRIGRIDGDAESAAWPIVTRTIVAGLWLVRLLLLLHLILLSGRAGGDRSRRFGDNAVARQREAERLAGLRLSRDFHGAVALAGILHGLEAQRIRGLELHRLRKNDDEVLGGIERLGIDLDLAGVGQSELQLELRFSGTEREVNRVAILLGLGRGFRADRLAVRGAGLYLFNLRAGGQIELEVVIVHLRLRGRRLVIDDKQAHALHASAVGLEADYVGGDSEAAYFGCDVIDVHVNRTDAGRRDLVIGDSLMHGADEVWS